MTTRTRGFVVRCPDGYISQTYRTREEAERKVRSIAAAGTCSHEHTIEEDE